MKKERIDSLMVLKGFVETISKSQALIMSGRVFLDEKFSKKILKPSERFTSDTQIFIKENQPYVSRGGLKLKKAIDFFNITLKNKVVLDVGASTGGFTDCCLQEGAKKVYALDVGKGLIDLKLRNDNRVEVIEKCNFRNIDKGLFRDKIDFITVDVSFISLVHILSNVFDILMKNGETIVLLKPQFEVQKGETQKGIVRDDGLREKVKTKIINLIKETGFHFVNIIESPITGAKGNIEYLIYAVKP